MVERWGERRTRLVTKGLALFGALLFCLSAPTVVGAQGGARADVVVVVDNSISMKEPGFDPERTTLLLARLFADLVPGKLSVVRMLDVRQDADLLPGEATGEVEPCFDDPSRECEVIEPMADWGALVEANRYGVLERPALGDSEFKSQLDSFLRQEVDSTPAALAFRAARGVFSSHGPADSDVPRFVVWLTDGRPQDPEAARREIDEFDRRGIRLAVVLFGDAEISPELTKGLGLWRAKDPVSLMRAVGGMLREVTQAPFEVSRPVARDPRFQIRPLIDEAWFVFFGDDTLDEVSLSRPDATSFLVDESYDRLEGAGAYRLARIQSPTPGDWSIQVGGGGSPAYAVVQRLALEPKTEFELRAMADTKFRFAIELSRAVLGETRDDLVVEAYIDGWIPLYDDGSRGDQQAGDRVFTTFVTFDQANVSTVQVRVRREGIDGWLGGVRLEVVPEWRYDGEPLAIQLGTLRPGDSVCSESRIPGDQELGVFPFEVETKRALPAYHRLEVRAGGEIVEPNKGRLGLRAGMPFELCLYVADPSPALTMRDYDLNLVASGTDGLPHGLPLSLSWRVDRPGGLPGWGLKLGLGLFLLVAMLWGLNRFGVLSMVFQRLPIPPIPSAWIDRLRQRLPFRLGSRRRALILASSLVLVLVVAIFFLSRLAGPTEKEQADLIRESSLLLDTGEYDELSTPPRPEQLERALKRSSRVARSDAVLAKAMVDFEASLQRAAEGTRSRPSLDPDYSTRLQVLGSLLPWLGAGSGTEELPLFFRVRAKFIESWMAEEGASPDQRLELIHQYRPQFEQIADTAFVEFLDETSVEQKQALISQWEPTLTAANTLSERVEVIRLALENDRFADDTDYQLLARRYLARWLVRSLLELEANPKTRQFLASLVPAVSGLPGRIPLTLICNELDDFHSLHHYQALGQKLRIDLPSLLGFSSIHTPSQGGILRELLHGLGADREAEVIQEMIGAIEESYLFSIDSGFALDGLLPLIHRLEDASTTPDLQRSLLIEKLGDGLVYMEELQLVENKIDLQIARHEIIQTCRSDLKLVESAYFLESLTLDPLRLETQRVRLSSLLFTDRGLTNLDRAGISSQILHLERTLKALMNFNKNPTIEAKESLVVELRTTLIKHCEITGWPAEACSGQR